MDRAEFLNRLEAQLLDVPQAEREEALQYYEDYLNDAGDAGDFDILQELGTPEEVADSIRNGLRQDSSGAGERSGQALPVPMRTPRAPTAMQLTIPTLPAERDIRSGCGFC